MISQLLPVFIVIAVGYFISLMRIADDQWVRILNKYGLYIGFPALIFANLIDVDASLLKEQIPVFLVTMVVIFLFMAITLLCVKRFKIQPGFGVVLFLGVFNGNIGYLGFPLITAVYPGTGAVISIVIAAYIISLFTFGLFMLESIIGGQKSFASIMKNIISSPFIIAIASGLLIVLTGIEVHPVLEKAISMVEASASPVVLIGLGIFLHKKMDLKALWKKLSVVFVIKMILFPAVFLALRALLPLPQTFDVAVLEAVMPLAITNFALSDRYPMMDKQLMVAAIILTTIITPLLYPLMLSLL